MHHRRVEFFEDWRDEARRLVAAEVPPSRVRWIDGRGQADGQGDLFGDPAEDTPLSSVKETAVLKVPVSFLALARTVAHHRDAGRWSLLYQLLWRISRGERHLLNVASDDDVIEATRMEKAVRRDAHKMKAFVRFRRVVDEQGEHYIAWHRPDHYSLRLTSEFFSRRFDVMRWTILTPDESVSWDGTRLTYFAGVPRSEAPDRDELESLWKTYYANIFNPARIKLAAMRAEMPKKHWATMPETELIDQMLRQAPRRVEQMVRFTNRVATAQAFVPESSNLEELRESAAACRGCDLCQGATQTVFGSGPADAKTVFIGEQPGDQEDRQGVPFIGPAGQLLNRVIEEVGLNRDQIYLTNVVKHFKFSRSGKRRLHKKPSPREVAACRPWLEAELALLRPDRIVCLGGTAAGAVFGPNFRITDRRGVAEATEYAPWTLATYHPSALLRARGESAAQMYRDFVSDLRQCVAAGL